MNRKISMIVIVLLAASILATPVLAIGPEQAAEVDNNPNLDSMFGGLINTRGEASGSNVWAYSTTNGGYWITWKWRDASDAKGLMNNALVPTTTTEMISYISSDYDNRWIFLSGKPATGHGMLYRFWMGFTLDASVASSMENLYPNGAFWMHNSIYNNSP
jgi:hypothetical protein